MGEQQGSGVNGMLLLAAAAAVASTLICACPPAETQFCPSQKNSLESTEKLSFVALLHYAPCRISHHRRRVPETSIFLCCSVRSSVREAGVSRSSRTRTWQPTRTGCMLVLQTGAPNKAQSCNLML